MESNDIKEEHSNAGISYKSGKTDALSNNSSKSNKKRKSMNYFNALEDTGSVKQAAEVDESSLSFSVEYIHLLVPMASEYMGRFKDGEDAYQSACGVVFNLPLFPVSLHLETSSLLLPAEEIEDDNNKYKPNFILLSRKQPVYACKDY
eukprot:CAMPEP_0119053680 /NCGR_PEP_ID=MMETSP1177-20130426/74577_1 /TAXON_ID=2985 /ORGANISM="Ochromonas sp, Strain CCMP1899" /LENGTH=147 /DNA_ID=CAMNT_0007033689 /DNA_START=280 /DNA_END=724 /DNA_ORIENTATION=-